MKWFISCVAAAILIVALPASAKKRPIELDPGFYRWDKFSYSEFPEAKKAQLRGSTIINRWGGYYIEFAHAVITYDGDSTLTSERSFRPARLSSGRANASTSSAIMRSWTSSSRFLRRR